jgi:hypothetical protein
VGRELAWQKEDMKIAKRICVGPVQKMNCSQYGWEISHTNKYLKLLVRCHTSMVGLEECSLENELVEASLDMPGSQMLII